jgi:hypothetical protein
MGESKDLWLYSVLLGRVRNLGVKLGALGPAFGTWETTNLNLSGSTRSQSR